MKLIEWMEERGMTLTAFAERADLDVTTAHRAVQGKGLPSKATMNKILATTGGAVTPNDWYDLPTDAPEPAREAAQ